MIPLKEPFQLHQNTDVLDAATVGEVETFGEVGLQVGFDLLIGFLTLHTGGHVGWWTGGGTSGQVHAGLSIIQHQEVLPG